VPGGRCRRSSPPASAPAHPPTRPPTVCHALVSRSRRRQLESHSVALPPPATNTLLPMTPLEQ
jgi:hypothetical protein